MKNIKGSIFLLVAALIWGTAFVAQSLGLNNVGSFTFNTVRNYVGAITLLPAILIINKFKKADQSSAKHKDKALIIGGISCGIVLAIASSLQQMGLEAGAQPGKAGFITALYIIFVPIAGIFTKKKPRATIWIAVLLAIIGMYLLCVKDGFYLEKADIYLFLCSIAFTFHILVVDKFSPLVDCVKLSCIQFFVCGTICLVCMFLFEEPTIANIKLAAIPILYTGIMSSGVAYTFQIIGQKYTFPSLATLIMSLESVFAALAGWVILHQAMSTPEIIGSGLVFAGILVAQLF